MWRAALNSDSISTAALRTFTRSRIPPIHGMAMAESMLMMPSVTVSSKSVKARRPIFPPGWQIRYHMIDRLTPQFRIIRVYPTRCNAE